MAADQTDPDAPASDLAKQEINKALTRRCPRHRKQIKVTFSGPGAPLNLTLHAEPEVSWVMMARQMVLALERQLAAHIG